MTKNDADKLICLPNTLLRQPSKKINFISDEVQRLAKAMQAVTLNWEDSREHEAGVALAAVQIGQPLKMVVVRNSFEDKKDRSFSVYINPRIIKTGKQIVEDYEGCLSVKDVYAKVPRYEQVKVKALDLEGKPIQMTVKGFLARVFQHEIDHTNGILFIDHIKDRPEAFFKLTKDGKLQKVNYDKTIRQSRILW